MPYRAGERTRAARIMEIINRIIETEKLHLWRADTEMIGPKMKSPDIVIKDNMRNEICVIEAKLPFIPVYQVDLFEKAYNYAHKTGIPYFATFNFNKLVLWKTHEKDVPLSDRRFKEYYLADVSSPEELEKPEVIRSVNRGLTEFLRDLDALLVKREDEILPSLSLDVIFINYLRSLIESMYIPLYEEIMDKAVHDPKFSKEIRDWFIEQGWDDTDVRDIAEKMSRQYTLLLINKILFYDILRAKYPEIRPKNYKVLGFPETLPELSIPKDLKDGAIVTGVLKSYFNKVLRIDYETIYTSNFLDKIDLPNVLVPQIRNLVNELSKYNFVKIEYEVLGNIFQSLIPEKDRHKFGQYFTRSDVVDLIIGATVTDKEDKILDPACGAGTFLVRSYSRLKYLGAEDKHREMLKKLWGVDIAKFPAHLSTINLAVRDLSETENYPKIAHNDFFNVLPQSPLSNSHFIVKGMSSKELKKQVPEFDTVITNPPYTRQEEMEDKTRKDYKQRVIDLLKKETDMTIGKRSSIYSYFFFHGAQFLNEHGRIGLITSNSWLDVDYGKYLQEFFLRGFKIKTIIESKVEKWFEDADINTCITILERCYDKEERNDNLVKFVQFRKKLPRVLEGFVDDDERFEDWDDKKRWEAIDNFYKWLDGINELTVDLKKGIRVYPVSQEELWDEGYDKEKKNYTGAKWGRYLRAPDIFFKILEKGKDLFVPLSKFAHIKRGFTTGANEFFYLTEDQIKKWGIEKEFWMHKEDGRWVPNYLIKSPKECESIIVKPKNLKYRVLMIHKDKKDLKGTNVLRYINEGETRVFGSGRKAGIPAQKPTCASRKRWYDLGKWEKPDILWSDAYNTRYVSFNVEDWADKRFFYIYLKEKKYKKIISAYLNSSIIPLLIEIDGITNLGQGAVYTNVYWLEKLPIAPMSKTSKVQIKKLEKTFSKLSKRPIGSVFEEIGAENPEDVSLEKVKKDRRELDKIIFDILGLNEEEQLEVYRAVVDLVKSRIDRAKSVDRKKEKKDLGVNLGEIKELVLRELDKELIEEVLEFEPKNFVEKEIEPKGEIFVNMDVLGIPYLQVGEKKIECDSTEEAIYLKFMLLTGKRKIKIPQDKKILKDMNDKLKHLNSEIKDAIKNILDLTVSDKNLKENFRGRVYVDVWRDIRKEK